MKWVRYERKHSMSAGHTNWHENSIRRFKIYAALDYTSRKILVFGVFAKINTENSIAVIRRAVQECGPICPLRELIMANGSEFGAQRRNENGDWDSEFNQNLGTHYIRLILTRVKHPQMNGKIETWFDTYKRFRYEFLLSMNSLSGTITDHTAT